VFTLLLFVLFTTKQRQRVANKSTTAADMLISSDINMMVARVEKIGSPIVPWRSKTTWRPCTMDRATATK
jgi:hypothetical protein